MQPHSYQLTRTACTFWNPRALGCVSSPERDAEAAARRLRLLGVSVARRSRSEAFGPWKEDGMKGSRGWRRIVSVTAAAAILGAPAIAGAKDEQVKYADRLTESKAVFQERSE